MERRRSAKNSYLQPGVHQMVSEPSFPLPRSSTAMASSDLKIRHHHQASSHFHQDLKIRHHQHGSGDRQQQQLDQRSEAVIIKHHHQHGSGDLQQQHSGNQIYHHHHQAIRASRSEIQSPDHHQQILRSKNHFRIQPQGRVEGKPANQFCSFNSFRSELPRSRSHQNRPEIKEEIESIGHLSTQKINEVIMRLHYLVDEGCFDSYFDKFVELVFPIDKLVTSSNESSIHILLMDLFVSGLRENTQLYVLKSAPSDLLHAMNLATYFEEEVKHEEDDPYEDVDLEVEKVSINCEEIKSEGMQSIEDVIKSEVKLMVDDEEYQSLQQGYKEEAKPLPNSLVKPPFISINSINHQPPNPSQLFKPGVGIMKGMGDLISEIETIQFPELCDRNVEEDRKNKRLAGLLSLAAMHSILHVADGKHVNHQASDCILSSLTMNPLPKSIPPPRPPPKPPPQSPSLTPSRPPLISFIFLPFSQINSRPFQKKFLYILSNPTFLTLQIDHPRNSARMKAQRSSIFANQAKDQTHEHGVPSEWSALYPWKANSIKPMKKGGNSKKNLNKQVVGVPTKEAKSEEKLHTSATGCTRQGRQWRRTPIPTSQSPYSTSIPTIASESTNDMERSLRHLRNRFPTVGEESTAVGGAITAEKSRGGEEDSEVDRAPIFHRSRVAIELKGGDLMYAHLDFSQILQPSMPPHFYRKREQDAFNESLEAFSSLFHPSGRPGQATPKPMKPICQ